MIRSMQTKSPMKMELLFDLESTGLLRQGSRIHCLVMRGPDDSDPAVFDHRPDQTIIQGITLLAMTFL